MGQSYNFNSHCVASHCDYVYKSLFLGRYNIFICYFPYIPNFMESNMLWKSKTSEFSSIFIKDRNADSKLRYLFIQSLFCFMSNYLDKAFLYANLQLQMLGINTLLLRLTQFCIKYWQIILILKILWKLYHYPYWTGIILNLQLCYSVYMSLEKDCMSYQKDCVKSSPWMEDACKRFWSVLVLSAQPLV